MKHLSCHKDPSMKLIIDHLHYFVIFKQTWWSDEVVWMLVMKVAVAVWSEPRRLTNCPFQTWLPWRWSVNPPHCGGVCWSTVIAQQSHSNSQTGIFNKRLQIPTPLKLFYLLFNKFEHLSEIPVKEKKNISHQVMWNSLREESFYFCICGLKALLGDDAVVPGQPQDGVVRFSLQATQTGI